MVKCGSLLSFLCYSLYPPCYVLFMAITPWNVQKSDGRIIQFFTRDSRGVNGVMSHSLCLRIHACLRIAYLSKKKGMLGHFPIYVSISWLWSHSKASSLLLKRLSENEGIPQDGWAKCGCAFAAMYINEGRDAEGEEEYSTRILLLSNSTRLC